MSKNIYDNTPESFAKVDSALMKANTAIGESSNLAQLALTYSYNFTDQKVEDAIAILSVLAQTAIDSAKRAFDVDIAAEIKRLKKEINVEEIGYPLFWFMLKRKNKFAKEKTDADPEKRKVMKGLNKSLICPMNHVCEMSFFPEKATEETIPMEHFFNPHPMTRKRKVSKKLEAFIEKYCSDLAAQFQEDEEIDVKAGEEEFEKMMEELRGCYIPEDSIGVVSNLINRAFKITPEMKANTNSLDSNLWRNKPILIKILYSINKNCLLNCLNKNIT